MQGVASKAAKNSGYDEIIHPSRGMRAGLKSVCVSKLLSWSER